MQPLVPYSSSDSDSSLSVVIDAKTPSPVKAVGEEWTEIPLTPWNIGGGTFRLKIAALENLGKEMIEIVDVDTKEKFEIDIENTQDKFVVRRKLEVGSVAVFRWTGSTLEFRVKGAGW